MTYSDLNDAGNRPAILSIGTALPRYSATQKDIGAWMAASFVDKPALQRKIRAIHSYSGIETRYSCTPEYLAAAEESPFAPGHPLESAMTTADRMEIYRRESTPLGCAAAYNTLTAYAKKNRASVDAVTATVTHLIVVSCTGFFAPGLDFTIAKQLKLAATVNRTLVGFMGCAAAFNALRLASQIVKGDPQARVLVVCVELCSLHGQPGEDRDLLVAASLFSDGAAACLIGQPSVQEGDYFSLLDFHTSMKPDTQEEMVWQIGDHGFSLRLSARIPEHLADVAPAVLESVFGSIRPSFWAIHPGGRAIVERLVDIFNLTHGQVHSTVDVLRRYGNMSSGTILFVLAAEQERLRQRRHTPDSEQQVGVAMAFGPGLVVEMARLAYVAEPCAATTVDAQRQVDREVVLA